MRREEISEAIGNISPKFILEAETYTWEKRRAIKLRRGGWIAAAILCLVVLLQALPALHPIDAFTVKAYALDLDEGGTVVLREADLLESSDYWGGYRDDGNFYVNMGLRYEGSNLKSVTFTTGEGIFAEQRITPGMSEDNVSKLYIGPENRLVVFGTQFETLGSTVTIEGGEMEEGLLLFWGVRADSMDDIPKNPKITATVVFQDGDTETVRVKLDLSGTAVFGGESGEASQGGAPVAQRQSRYYKNLPLEDCALVDEQTVTDVYEYTVDDYTISLRVPEEQQFDGNGVYRMRRLRISGAFYLPVFQKDRGILTARLYRVPDELEFSLENEQKAAVWQVEPSVPSPAVPAPPEDSLPETAVPEQKPETLPGASAEKDAGAQTSAGAPAAHAGGSSTDDVWARIERQGAYYSSLSLDKCELVDEKPMTDSYRVVLAGISFLVQVEEGVDFGEDGFYRSNWHSGSDGTFIAGAYRDGDGNLFGRLYRVPDGFIYSE